MNTKPVASIALSDSPGSFFDRGMRSVAVALVLAVLAGCRPPAEPVSLAPEAVEPPPVAPETVLPLVEPPPKSEWTASASAVQEDIFPASNVCDGQPGTRWSSPASDPQWVQVDMGQTATVCGVVLKWEDAFGRAYSVQTSEDGVEWLTAYSTEIGDGKTDDIYFKPVLARFVRVHGTKRATGWGYSLWEIDVKGPAEQIVLEAAAAPGRDASFAADGRLDTVWTSAQPGPCTLRVDLRKEKDVGGLRIDWGANHATALRYSVSADGSSWADMAELKGGIGKFDVLLHAGTKARYLRLDVTETADNKPAEIADLTLRGADEPMTPLTLYELAAAKTAPGVYPEQLWKRQVYWTITGLAGDSRESLLDEYGNIEPFARSSTLMPYLFVGGRLYSALDAAAVSQSLDDGHLPMPTVSWDLKPVGLTVDAITYGTLGKAVTYARYTARNNGAEPVEARLLLAIRPIQINPTWQHGGLSPITSIELTNTPVGKAVSVNGMVTYLSMAEPSAFGVRAFDGGDVAIELLKGVVPETQKMDQGGDMLSGALAYDLPLQPGEEKAVIVAMPLFGRHEDIIAFLRRGFDDTYPSAADAFAAKRQELHHVWAEQVDKIVIDLPERAVADTMKSQVAYILVNRDGVAIQPGSRNYKRSWIRDGCLTSAGLLRMGVVEPVREYLEWYSARVQPDGWVPPILENNGEINKGFGWDNEYDSQGEFVFAIVEFYRFTKDRAFLERHFPAIERALTYLVALRERTLAPDYMKDVPARERFVGILPPSISHEGYSPAMHSYWDDFFALKGWKDGIEAAEILGLTNTAAWARGQLEALRASVKASIEKTMEFKKIDFVPGCADKGDVDPTSTTIAFFPCKEQGILPQAALQTMYERYINEVKSRLEPGWSAGFTPYEIRNITALVSLGHKDWAKFLLDYLLDCRRPADWNHLAEVVLGDYRMGSYIGDMPHTWVGSGYINAVRGMMIREEDDRLVLLAGVPEGWVTQGRGMRLERMPTHFGTVDLSAKADAGRLTLAIGGSAQPPAGIHVTWPLAGRPAAVTVDGQPWTDYDELGCRLPAGPHRVEAAW